MWRIIRPTCRHGSVEAYKHLRPPGGAPTSTTQNGTVRLLTYIRNDGTFVAGGYWGPRVQSLFCTTTFSVVNGLIAQAQFEGNECVAY